MSKKKVTMFFSFLLAFALILMIVQMSSYGSLTGFVSFNQNQKTEFNNKNIDYSQFLNSTFYTPIIAIAGFFIVRFIYNHNNRLKYAKVSHFDRKLIRLDIK